MHEMHRAESVRINAERSREVQEFFFFGGGVAGGGGGGDKDA